MRTPPFGTAAQEALCKLAFSVRGPRSWSRASGIRLSSGGKDMDERLCWLLACHGYVKETRADDGRVIYTPTPEGLRKADEIRPF
jgi:hypothetical protein